MFRECDRSSCSDEHRTVRRAQKESLPRTGHGLSMQPMEPQGQVLVRFQTLQSRSRPDPRNPQPGGG